MPKKPKKTEEGDAADAAAPEAGSPEAVGGLLPSPCLQRGRELLFHPTAHEGDRIEALFGMCSSPGELFVFVQRISLTAVPEDPVVNQTIASSDPVPLDLSVLEPGRYSILWKYAAFASSWQVFAEIQVNGVTRFRRYQTSGDSIPSSKVLVTLEVLP